MTDLASASFIKCIAAAASSSETKRRERERERQEKKKLNSVKHRIDRSNARACVRVSVWFIGRDVNGRNKEGRKN